MDKPKNLLAFSVVTDASLSSCTFFIWLSSRRVTLRSEGAETLSRYFTGASVSIKILSNGAWRWKRGANENTNGLIRQYFSKGTNFKDITNKDLALVVKKLNHRPRKYLNYQTPHEAFYSAIRGALAA